MSSPVEPCQILSASSGIQIQLLVESMTSRLASPLLYRGVHLQLNGWLSGLATSGAIGRPPPGGRAFLASGTAGLALGQARREPSPGCCSCAAPILVSLMSFLCPSCSSDFALFPPKDSRYSLVIVNKRRRLSRTRLFPSMALSLYLCCFLSSQRMAYLIIHRGIINVC
jgi:hypothetical protein